MSFTKQETAVAVTTFGIAASCLGFVAPNLLGLVAAIAVAAGAVFIVRRVGPDRRSPLCVGLPSPEVSLFLRRHNLTDHFVFGTNLELVHAPNLRTGWELSKMHFEVDPERSHLPQSLSEVCDRWKEDHPDNPDLPRYQLSDVRGSNHSDAPFIEFTFESSRFSRIYPVQEVLDQTFTDLADGDSASPREAFAKVLLNLAECPLPNFLVCHIAVVTSNRQLACFERSKHHGHYYPGKWSISFEEQLCEKDLRGNFFVECIRRGVEEELGYPSGEVSDHDIRIQSVFREFWNLTTGCCAIVHLQATSDELRERWLSKAVDRSEASRLRFLDAGLLSIATVLRERCVRFVTGEVVEEKMLHPTSLYRIWYFGLAEFGARLDRALGKTNAP